MIFFLPKSLKLCEGANALLREKLLVISQAATNSPTIADKSMINSILPRKARIINRLAWRFCPEFECRVPLSLLRNLLADRQAYRQLLAQHRKALAVLAIHAADDAGAREVLETNTFVARSPAIGQVRSQTLFR